MSARHRIKELEDKLQEAINERNEAWCQLEEKNIEIRPVVDAQETTNHFTIPDNREFCEQMANAIEKLGAEETLACMARMMIGLSHRVGEDIQFDCELGSIAVERKFIANYAKN